MPISTYHSLSSARFHCHFLFSLFCFFIHIYLTEFHWKTYENQLWQTKSDFLSSIKDWYIILAFIITYLLFIYISNMLFNKLRGHCFYTSSLATYRDQEQIIFENLIKNVKVYCRLINISQRITAKLMHTLQFEIVEMI